MSSLDLDIESQMSSLELEWRQAYESSVSLRAQHQALSADPKANPDLLIRALDQLDHTEALKSRIMAKIERLEDCILGRD